MYAWNENAFLLYADAYEFHAKSVRKRNTLWTASTSTCLHLLRSNGMFVLNFAVALEFCFRIISHSRQKWTLRWHCSLLRFTNHLIILRFIRTGKRESARPQWDPMGHRACRFPSYNERPLMRLTVGLQMAVSASQKLLPLPLRLVWLNFNLYRSNCIRLPPQRLSYFV